MREVDLQEDIYQLVTLCGYTIFYTHKIGAHKHRPVLPGISDFIGIIPGGLFFAIEVKLPGEIPTKDQTAFIDQVNRAGGIGFVAESLEDVVKALELPYDLEEQRIYRR
jgi:hypothetical protein